MSVAFCIFSEDETKQVYVPVSVQEDFRKYWVPSAEHLQLPWFPHFEMGISIREEDVAEVIDEVDKLSAFMFSEQNTIVPFDIAEHISERLRNLRNALTNINWSDDPDVFIG